MKSLVWIGAVVGGFLGGMAPELWGGDTWSLSGVACSTLGGFFGIWLGWRIQRSM